MAEKILKSPGVSAREIDLSAPGQVRVQGVPAAVIGTAQRGPAFVPVTFATYADFKAQFGGSDGEKFGPIAVAEWMKNASDKAFEFAQNKFSTSNMIERLLEIYKLSLD